MGADAGNACARRSMRSAVSLSHCRRRPRRTRVAADHEAGERGNGEREHARVYPNARSDAAAASKTYARGMTAGASKIMVLATGAFAVAACAAMWLDEERPGRPRQR